MRLLRVKQPNFEVSLLDVDKIIGWAVELVDEGWHELMVITDVQVTICLCRGTFAECHTMLNKIIDKMNYDVIDI